MNKKIFIFTLSFIISLFCFINVSSADYYSEYKTLKQGMNNSDVTNLQKDLDLFGYYYYKYPTGYFGSITTRSVMDYQKSKNLYVDGIVGHNTARQLKVDKVLSTARSYWGIPYVWGGTSTSGFDCSGYTHYVLLKNDIIIPRSAVDQYQTGTWVSKSNLKPGDLVFFSTYKAGASHVGFYIGNGQFIHASSAAGYITVSNLSTTYYAEHYIGAKRVIN